MCSWRIALKHLDLTGNGTKRGRRPTQGEPNQLMEYADNNLRQIYSAWQDTLFRRGDRDASGRDLSCRMVRR